MNPDEKKKRYIHVLETLHHLIGDENDDIAIMATVVCELHHTFEYFHWTGFYRRVKNNLLKIGPYQGSHGCLTISFDRGICGKAAREKKTQLVRDVRALPYHIACSSNTRSEIVVPILTSAKEIHSVLDIDSDNVGAFDEVDQEYLEQLAGILGEKFYISI